MRAPHIKAAEKRVLAALLAQGEAAAKAYAAGKDWREAVQRTEKRINRAVMESVEPAFMEFAVATHDGILANRKSVADFVLERWASIFALMASEGRAATLITTTTVNLLASLIERAIAEGLSIRETTQRMRTIWPEMSASRAERIARTEIIAASNYASIEGAKATNLDLEKFWMATVDDRVRSSHANMDGVAADAEGVFPIGGGMLYPGDPAGPPGETINCRCTIGWREK